MPFAHPERSDTGAPAGMQRSFVGILRCAQDTLPQDDNAGAGRYPKWAARSPTPNRREHAQVSPRCRRVTGPALTKPRSAWRICRSTAPASSHLLSKQLLSRTRSFNEALIGRRSGRARLFRLLTLCHSEEAYPSRSEGYRRRTSAFPALKPTSRHSYEKWLLSAFIPCLAKKTKHGASGGSVILVGKH